jgi:hypothetical protein
MAKNTSSNAFRRIDVDQYAEDNYKVNQGYKCTGPFKKFADPDKLSAASTFYISVTLRIVYINEVLKNRLMNEFLLHYFFARLIEINNYRYSLIPYYQFGFSLLLF